MKRVAVVATLALLGAAMSQAAGAATGAPAARTDWSVRCDIDDAGAAGPRRAAQAEALAMATDMIAGDKARAYAHMTAHARQQQSAEDFGQYPEDLLTFAPWSELRIVSTYVVTREGDGAPTQTVCGDTADHPERVVVRLLDTPLQVMTVLEAKTADSDWVFAVLTTPEGSGWKVSALHYNDIGMAGLRGAEVAALARAERAAGRTFNATLLYDAAYDLYDFGPNLEPSGRADLQQEFADFARAPELGLRAPATWNVNGRNQYIREAVVTGVDGKLWLYIKRKALMEFSTEHSSAVEADNRRFVNDLRRWRPELTDAFAGIIVQGEHPNEHTLWGTFWSKEKGFE